MRPAARKVDGPYIRPARQTSSYAPELDCLRGRLAPHALDAATARAARTGGGAQDSLIAWGLISEAEYVAALAHAIGIPFDALVWAGRLECSLSDGQLVRAPSAGKLLLEVRGQPQVVVVPRGLEARRLVETLSANPALKSRIRLTTADCLTRYVTRHAAREIAYCAAEALKTEQPALSAAGGGEGRRSLILATTAGLGVGLLAAPITMLAVLQFFLTLVFVEWLVLRLMGTLVSTLPRQLSPQPDDSRLPVYSVLVALYRERASVHQLVAALRALDYPPEKLDIKFVVEADDTATRNALAAMELRAPFEIVIAPESGPRTKPKALNAALPLARGAYVVVYDAEDRPEPDQLRLAVQAFRTDSERLACVQARLTIDNTSDSWLTRLYTSEYASLFDAFLPGIAAWRFPLPLGGSSNHFRTVVLRKIGAWDPYNVTEDADLGMRLARFGFRTGVLDSSTYEEAPSRFTPWLKQRTRWFKGWMQTWLVHMRNPIKLCRELGAVNFLVFQLLVAGSVLAAMVHPLFLVGFGLSLASAWTEPGEPATADIILKWLYGSAFFGGYLVSIVVGAVGLARRGLLRFAWSLLLTPLYWLCLSIAAWRGLWQLVRSPYRWEKTEHGLARTSRRGPTASPRAAFRPAPGTGSGTPGGRLPRPARGPI
jgi:cellulose synthase/poly-beta-1,6-N-acetylglucosamine synthase-like glycosyltransferase